MEKLKKQLKREEQHKQFLEQELLEDQRKMKELEQKYSLQVSQVQILKLNKLILFYGYNWSQHLVIIPRNKSSLLQGL